MTSAETRPEMAWGALASIWDTSGAAWNQPTAERLVTLAGLYPGMNVLDIGCGAGAASLPAARAVTPGGWVTGVDSAASMVLRARQAARDAGITNVGFDCEDAASLPYTHSSYDAVIASMVVSHLPEPAAALDGWRKLLRKDGLQAFSWVGADDPAWRPAFDAVDSFLPSEQQWSRYMKRWTVTEAQAMLPAGITASTAIEPVTTRYESMDHWWQSAWTQAQAIIWSRIPASQRDDARKAAFAVLAGLQGRDGSLERTRTVCYTVARLTPPFSTVPAQADGT